MVIFDHIWSELQKHISFPIRTNFYLYSNGQHGDRQIPVLSENFQSCYLICMGGMLSRRIVWKNEAKKGKRIWENKKEGKEGKKGGQSPIDIGGG